MVSTKMMMMTLNQAKSAEDRYSVSSTSSAHFSDHDSRPSTACSSTDMCTPMPNSTFSNIDSKRFSTASDCSLMSAPHLSTASSDAESTDSPAPKPALPVTPPASSNQNAQSDPTSNKKNAASPSQAAMQSWQTQECYVPSGAQPSEVDSSYPGPAEQAPTYNAFSAWRPQPSSQQPPYEYHRLAGAFMDGSSGHSRSDSYQSTVSSTDSWNSRSQTDSSVPFVGYPNGLAASMAQMNLNPLSNALPGMGLYPAALGGMKTDAFAGAYPAANATARQTSADQARNLVNSLASLTAGYPAAPAAYAAQPMMDPQALMAYTAAFGGSPLLDLYGFTPELLAARTNALAQLANGAGLNYGGLSQNGGDDGPSPTNKKTNLYKTELCRSWEEKGTCRYGSKCQFAHGQEELKNVSRHPKFKTEVCRTFWLHGSCPYGKRCCFLHTTATDAGVPAAPSTRDQKDGSKSGRNAHDPPTSRLQQRLSSGTSSVNGTSDKSFGVSLSGYLSSSPQLQSAPPTRSLSDMGHSRSNSSSSCSLSSDGSSRIDNLRIQIGSRFGAREQVPPQDAPAPRSRLERLRPTGDYFESTSSMPSTSTASTTRYSPFLDRHQPPHSAFSDILSRSPSQHISKARSANGDAEPQLMSSRLSASANTLV
ncbi:hypothetical protein PGT21_034260 [Puccinia graminis f. sp. tritici]|uniref:C3H1-type domain-containing protein n=1 Tax=Puccinia graminis f. sp. tritici TaxID=56615 RepID=A0A5B0R2L1_PUCGR|nr:hypothetical protein PGT21_034260 [Puccinia graminis f. sp. tritici]